MTFCSILLTGLFVLLVLSSNFELVRSNKVGDLSTKSHGVSGAVYILDEKRIFIQGFSYDGLGPDAFFYVSSDSSLPNEEGILVPYPPGSNAPLGAFSKKNITLVLPDDIETSDLRWLAVWCKKFSVNFGDFIFPHDLMYIDDGDNNSNNGDDGDDDEYNSNNPETHEDHHHSSSGDSIRSSARSFLIFSAIVLTTKKFLNSF